MGQGIVTIHVLPHIRRYLLVRLAPGERLAEPTTQDLIDHMSRALRLDVLHVAPDKDPGTKSAVRLLVRTLPASGHVGSNALDRLNGMLEQTYRRHSHTWMDWLRDTTGASIMTSLDTWRSRYGVSDEDQAFETARMAYARHRKRVGRMMPRGGARFGSRQVQGYAG